MTKHLVSCECGQGVAVETTQAGETVTCSCGRQVSVPALRSLKQLPRAEVAVEKTVARGWSSTQGALFATGMILLVCGLLMSAFALIRNYQFNVPAADQTQVSQWVNMVDDFTLEQQWEFWLEARNDALPRGYSEITIMREVAASYWRFLFVGLATALVGLLLCGIAWLVRPSRHPQVAGKSPAKRSRAG